MIVCTPKTKPQPLIEPDTHRGEVDFEEEPATPEVTAVSEAWLQNLGRPIEKEELDELTTILASFPTEQASAAIEKAIVHERDIVEGTTTYFPVLVEGGMFSIGDPHVARGDGEISGTAIEGDLRVVYEIELIKNGRDMPSPQYESDTHYSVTGYGVTIDDAAKMATRAMLDYIVDETGMDRTEAYVLASLAADLKIAEVVDVPHMLVTMRIDKGLLNGE